MGYDFISKKDPTEYVVWGARCKRRRKRSTEEIIRTVLEVLYGHSVRIKIVTLRIEGRV